MPEVRYGDGTLIEDIGRFLKDSLLQDPQLHVVFIPHIHKDIPAINHCLNCLPDELIRTQISVAPYNMGNYFQLYKCDLTIAMRFHANVCSLVQGTKTIGINTYPQIQHLYEGLGIEGLANTIEEVQELSVKRLNQQYKLPSVHEIHGKIRQWLNSCT